jgi:hypothetical protein
MVCRYLWPFSSLLWFLLCAFWFSFAGPRRPCTRPGCRFSGMMRICFRNFGRIFCTFSFWLYFLPLIVSPFFAVVFFDLFERQFSDRVSSVFPSWVSGSAHLSRPYSDGSVSLIPCPVRCTHTASRYSACCLTDIAEVTGNSKGSTINSSFCS